MDDDSRAEFGTESFDRGQMPRIHITHWTVLKLSSVSDRIAAAVAILSSRLPSRIPVRRTDRDRSMRKSFYSASSLARSRRIPQILSLALLGPTERAHQGRSQKAQKYRPIWSRQRTRRGFDRPQIGVAGQPRG